MLGVVKLVPVPNALPPVDAANHDMVPAEAVAPKVTVPVPILDPGVVPVMVGKALTVAFAVLFKAIVVLQLLLVSLVMVIVVVPVDAKLLVVKLPIPAVDTVMVVVLPVAAFGADKL